MDLSKLRPRPGGVIDRRTFVNGQYNPGSITQDDIVLALAGLRKKKKKRQKTRRT